jgi:Leucine-rich repeat (LRR) protein
MSFVPDDNPEMIALLDGAHKAETELDELDGRPGLPWLVLADWLDERGDPRAELTRHIADRNAVECRHWLKAHAAEWFGPLPSEIQLTTNGWEPELMVSLGKQKKVPARVAQALGAGWLTLQCDRQLLPQLPRLRRLHLPSNALAADLTSLPTETIQTLRILNCRRLSKAGFRQLFGCPQLRELHIAFPRTLADADLAPLANCSTLRSLRLDNCSLLTGSTIGKLTGLRRLEFRHCPTLSIPGLNQLRDLSALEHLAFHFSPSKAPPLGRLPALPNLRSLDLGHNGSLRDSGLACLSRFPQLERLNLTSCYRITLQALAALAEPSALRVLIFDGSVRDEGMAILAHCTGLRELSLFPRVPVIDVKLAHLAGARRLRKLTLSKWHLTGADLATFPSDELEELTLGSCPSLTDACLSSLVEMRRLRRLSLVRCESLTDAGLARLSALPELQELTIDSATFTDGALRHLATLRSLQSLDLGYSGPFSPDALARLAVLPDLREVQIGVWERSPAELDALRKRLPHCTVEAYILEDY